jgi:hypothetical protein
MRSSASYKSVPGLSPSTTPASTTPSSSNRYSFPYKPEILTRDVVMIPAGWDSWNKIRAIREGFECEEMATEVVEFGDGTTKQRSDIYQDIIVDMTQSPVITTLCCCPAVN